MRNSQREYIQARKIDSEIKKSYSSLLVSLSLFVLVASLVVAGGIYFLHSYFGKQTVTYVLVVIGVLTIGFMFAFLNDRSQERATRAAIQMSINLTRGVNQVLSESAKTYGQQNREIIRTEAQKERWKIKESDIEYPEEIGETKFIEMR